MRAEDVRFRSATISRDVDRIVDVAVTVVRDCIAIGYIRVGKTRTNINELAHEGTSVTITFPAKRTDDCRSIQSTIQGEWSKEKIN